MKDSSGIILNLDTETRDRQTYIIFGNPRGGTTMISNILIRFQIFMGENLSNNLEDSLFNIDHLRKKK